MHPHNDILSRTQEPQEFQEFLIEIGSLVDECVNYGTHVMNWCNSNPKGHYGELTIILLFRHMLEVLDGISVLVRNCCVEPTAPLLRSFFEAVLGLEFILEQETEKRGIAYQVAHAHRRISLYKKLNPSTAEGRQFRQSYKKQFNTTLKINLDLDYADKIQNLKRLLERPDFKMIDIEWQRVKQSINRNPNWFSLFDGPQSIEQLAIHLGHGSSYDTLYRFWSQEVHATGVIENLTVNSDGTGAYWGLRHPVNLKSYVSLAISMALSSYRSMIKYCAPIKLDDFSHWYVNIIRKPFHTLLSTELLIND